MIRKTRYLPAQDIRQIRGIPVTSPARTLLDLASTLTPTALKYAFIEADRLGLLDDGDHTRSSASSASQGESPAFGGASPQRKSDSRPQLLVGSGTIRMYGLGSSQPSG